MCHESEGYRARAAGCPAGGPPRRRGVIEAVRQHPHARPRGVSGCPERAGTRTVARPRTGRRRIDDLGGGRRLVRVRASPRRDTGVEVRERKVGEPFQVMAAGCGAYVSNGFTAPSVCHSEPTMVGLWMYRRESGRRAVWRGFACDDHAEQLLAARALLPRDRDVLARRRDRHRTELAGRRWAGEREGPLARGAEADQLVERALAWVGRNSSG